MDLMTSSQVAKGVHISTRTLRYYEQIGLLNSKKKEDYAYREKIIFLRKLNCEITALTTMRSVLV